MDQQEVFHYGVHTAPGNIIYLHQQRGAMNAVGLKQMSPFVVHTSRHWICNHVIPLAVANPSRSHLIHFEKLIASNSLVRFMLPLPKDATTGAGILTTHDKDDDLLQITMLLKMSSPVKAPIFWLKFTTPKMIYEELHMTNVQPIVVIADDLDQTAAAKKLIQVARAAPRRLLMLVNPEMPIKANLDDEHLASQNIVDLALLPWEALGAVVLRAHMRNEWGGLWFTREPTPANERKETKNESSTP